MSRTICYNIPAVGGKTNYNTPVKIKRVNYEVSLDHNNIS